MARWQVGGSTIARVVLTAGIALLCFVPRASAQTTPKPTHSAVVAIITKSPLKITSQGPSASFTLAPAQTPPVGTGTANWQAPDSRAWVLVAFLLALAVFFVMSFSRAGTNIMRRAHAVLAVLVGLFAFGLLVTPWIPLGQSDRWIFLDLVAIAIAVTAAFVGFLFGLPQTAIPSSGTDAGTTARLKPSTNLESVADTLTKYITGAAFASIAVAATYVDDFGMAVHNGLAASSAGKPIDVPFGSLLGDAVLLYYGPLGFLLGYILTRTIGGYVFARADSEMLDQGREKLDEWTVLPDVGPDAATDDQRSLATRVAAISFQELETDDQRLTWARAQTILEHNDQAEIAYRVLYSSKPNDPQIMIEFATTLYNDMDFKDCGYILQLADKAAALLGPSDKDGRARVAGLKAATLLYEPNGYVDAIRTVNDFLVTGIPPTRSLRFYRACAFGQLYRAYRDANQLDVNEPNVSGRIINDAAITIGFGQQYVDELLVVSDDKYRPADRPFDDDLQAFTADNAAYRNFLGLQAAPPQPQTPVPQVVALPGDVTPAQFASNSPP